MAKGGLPDAVAPSPPPPLTKHRAHNHARVYFSALLASCALLAVFVMSAAMRRTNEEGGNVQLEFVVPNPSVALGDDFVNERKPDAAAVLDKTEARKRKRHSGEIAVNEDEEEEEAEAYFQENDPSSSTTSEGDSTPTDTAEEDKSTTTIDDDSVGEQSSIAQDKEEEEEEVDENNDSDKTLLPSPWQARNWTGIDWPSGKDVPEEFYPLAPKRTIARRIFNEGGKGLWPNNTLLDMSRAAGRGTALSDDPEDGDPRRSRGVHVITTFFKGNYHAARFSEIVAALVSNLENPHVTLVHALWEREDPRKYLVRYPELLNKLVAREVKRQPTYSSMFQYVNTNLKRGSIAIITNADIFFDASLRCIRGPEPDSLLPNGTRIFTPRKDGIKGKIAYAISRRQVPYCGLLKTDHGRHFDLCKDYVHSHDAFLFAPPMEQRVISRTNHPQNRYGAENIVIYELAAAGYRVFNPCKKLKAFHLHCSEERHYATVFIDGSQGSGGPNRHGTVWPGTVRNSVQKWGWKVVTGLRCGEVVN